MVVSDALNSWQGKGRRGRYVCIRCGLVYQARGVDARGPGYICSDCKWGDPEYVKMVRTNERKRTMSRVAYALEQFVAQVKDLYPEVEVDYGDADGLNVVRDATFDKATSKALAKQLPGDVRYHSTMYRNQLTITVSALSPLADDRRPFDLPTPAAPKDAADEAGDGGSGGGSGDGDGTADGAS